MRKIGYPAITICLLICIGTLCNCKKEEKDLPSLITVIISSVTKDSALLGGLIINDGGTDITARGVCYGTESSPNISGTKTINGRGKGTFISSLTGLTPNTLYYARAYATNSEGTGYGNEINFKTSLGAPPVGATVITVIPTGGISYYSANAGGRITDDGGGVIIEIGISWGSNKYPTIINDNKIISDQKPDYYGDYRGCEIDSLQPDTYYYARAYVINSADTSFGDNVTIKTLAVPEVTTITATEITDVSATVGGNIITLGEASDVEIGICYGTEINPLFEGQHIKTASTDPVKFTCRLTNLLPGVTYHARAYVAWGDEWIDWEVIWPKWIVYGNELTFRTSE